MPVVLVRFFVLLFCVPRKSRLLRLIVVDLCMTYHKSNKSNYVMLICLYVRTNYVGLTEFH
jgi:hypothetical protein